jgi:hypothetical protein
MTKSAFFKNLPIGFIFISSFLFSKNAVGQAILGKWNQVTAKQYFTDEGAKKYGKPYIETDMSTIGTVIYEFKSDHSFLISSGTGPDADARTYTGSWSLVGDQLIMTDQKGNKSMKSTMSMQSGMMTIETLHPDSKITRKVALTFKAAN